MTVNTTNVYTNSSSWMAMAIETSYGTVAATPAYWIPVKSPKIQAVITEVDDDSFRGSMVKVYDQIPTVRHDEYTFTCLTYISTLPALLRSILGSTDTITGTVAPYTHTIGLLNNAPTTGNQPPSYTFFDFDGYVVRQIGMGQVDELNIKFTATGLVELTVKVLGAPFTLRGTVPSTAFDAIEAAPSWSCTPTLNSVASSTLVDGEIDMKRGSKPVHVIGQQGPYKIQVGPLEITGKLTVINQTDTELGWYLNNSQIPISLLFTPPTASADTFTFQMSTVKFSNGSQDRGPDELIVTALDMKPLPNSTDAVAGGVSPIKTICLTSQSTTY